MQFIDLKTQYLRIEQQVQKAVAEVVASQQYIMGPQVAELEEKLAEFVGVKHAISCSSGTDALVIPLIAYKLSQDDAVFVPSFTFFASAESITLAGATPVFVDCDPLTFNISAETLDEAYQKTVKEGRLNPRGVIAVDLFGLPAPYDEIEAFAKKHNLFLLEDAAQSFGATLSNRRTGSFGNVAATSFFPAKPLGAYGDGGAIFTDDNDMAKLFTSVRVHGQGVDKYDNVRIGINGRLDTIQAAILLEKLKIFDEEITLRNEVALAYTEKLQDVLQTPHVPSKSTSVWAQYSLLALSSKQREDILQALANKGIPTAVYYQIPIHLSSAYRHLGYQKGSLPICEELSQKIFSLPMHPYLSAEDIDAIVTEIVKVLS